MTTILFKFWPGFTPAIAIPLPTVFRVVAMQAYVPGSVAGQGFAPGAVVAQDFSPGSVAGQGAN